MKWIKVSERLPELEEGDLSTEVIINSHVENATDRDVVLSGVFYSGRFYICAEWEGGNPEVITPITEGRITHWMPLPSPPNRTGTAQDKNNEQ